MTQKDKVKELVGRGLHSYHTKALQQMDRIEKKNKEQNHKISILTNELDNDYLTKTEECSVVSLEHSKEGMVCLDELQGNTLVNYCTDGSKEMTLNGDIDVEGTFVTTTEGVDNGKVDVMCEGNTLVNKLYKIKNYGSEFGKHGWGNSPNCSKFEWIDNGIKMYALSSDTKLDRYYRSRPDKYGIFKKNRTYVVRMNVNSNDLQQNATILRCFYGNGTVFMNGQMSEVVNGVFIKKATTSSTIEEVDAIHSMISLDYRTLQGVDGWVSFQNVMVIDVTDLPSYQQDVEYWRNIEYFEGMKSVGQDDENGHKIEILSTTKNLFSTWKQGNILENGTEDTSEENVKSDFISVLPNTKYICSNDGVKRATHFVFYDKDKQHIGSTSRNNPSEKCTTPYNCRFVRLTGASNLRDKTQFEIGETITPYNSTSSLNKKEILINEPLRGLPSGIKDRFVKIGGKWYIERNCGEVKGTDKWYKNNIQDETSGSRFKITLNDCKKIRHIRVVCNLLTHQQKVSYREVGTYISSDEIDQYGVLCIRLADDIEESDFKSKYEDVSVIYPLETPIYEPLEVEPTLNTYNDVTHISNNSIIPCTMKVKNSGYNAIIKPSTLYTVALDTNKSGTIGMNLGGTKGTTTNNVLTLTTPATLTDDSLRIYGKGIKGSKVRLLEGDKTNWIPSFFEGMKSCFEDRIQEDGTYKMEILSNDMSLFDIHERNFYIGNGASNLKIIQRKIEYDADANYRYLYYDRFDFVKGKKYTIAIKGNNSRVLYYNNNNFQATGITSNNIRYVTFVAGHNAYTHGIENGERGACKVVIEDVWIYEGEYNESKHTTTKSNKIQFSSIEPLRSTKDISDRFIFKDGKLMIERNCIERDLTYFKFSTTEIKGLNLKGGITISDAYRQPQGGANTTMKCDKLASDFKENIIPCINIYHHVNQNELRVSIPQRLLKTIDKDGINDYFVNNPHKIIYRLAEPTYEEIPFEIQKIILEGYENGTLFIDTNIPPTVTTTYAGETPIVKSVKLNKTEVLNNTNDINDNIIPYLMDMDYRVVCLQLESNVEGISMARLFGGTYEMLKRDIQSNRLTKEEYGYRLIDYFNAGKLTEEEVRELEDLK